MAHDLRAGEFLQSLDMRDIGRSGLGQFRQRRQVHRPDEIGKTLAARGFLRGRVLVVELFHGQGAGVDPARAHDLGILRLVDPLFADQNQRRLGTARTFGPLHLRARRATRGSIPGLIPAPAHRAFQIGTVARDLLLLLGLGVAWGARFFLGPGRHDGGFQMAERRLATLRLGTRERRISLADQPVDSRIGGLAAQHGTAFAFRAASLLGLALDFRQLGDQFGLVLGVETRPAQSLSHTRLEIVILVLVVIEVVLVKGVLVRRRLRFGLDLNSGFFGDQRGVFLNLDRGFLGEIGLSRDRLNQISNRGLGFRRIFIGEAVRGESRHCRAHRIGGAGGFGRGFRHGRSLGCRTLGRAHHDDTANRTRRGLVAAITARDFGADFVFQPAALGRETVAFLIRFDGGQRSFFRSTTIGLSAFGLFRRETLRFYAFRLFRGQTLSLKARSFFRRETLRFGALCLFHGQTFSLGAGGFFGSQTLSLKPRSFFRSKTLGFGTLCLFRGQTFSLGAGSFLGSQTLSLKAHRFFRRKTLGFNALRLFRGQAFRLGAGGFFGSQTFGLEARSLFRRETLRFGALGFFHGQTLCLGAGSFFGSQTLSLKARSFFRRETLRFGALRLFRGQAFRLGTGGFLGSQKLGLKACSFFCRQTLSLSALSLFRGQTLSLSASSFLGSQTLGLKALSFFRRETFRFNALGLFRGQTFGLGTRGFFGSQTFGLKPRSFFRRETLSLKPILFLGCKALGLEIHVVVKQTHCHRRFGRLDGGVLGFVLSLLDRLQLADLGDGGADALQLSRNPRHLACIQRLRTGHEIGHSLTRRRRRRLGSLDSDRLGGGLNGGSGGQRRGRRHRRTRGGGTRSHRSGRRFLACLYLRAQDHTVILNLGLDPALDLALGNLVQHLGIGSRRFGAEIAILGREIPEILGNRFHRVERFVKPFERAREGAVGYRQNLARTDHAFSSPA